MTKMAAILNKGVVEKHGPRVVVSTATFHARVWCSFPGLGGLKETKLFIPTRKTQYCR